MKRFATMIGLLRPPDRCMVCYQDPCIHGSNCP
jgi:hypothetical protein